jgi:peptidoglycan/xylan/chitin deacetylase (PgdA/CDA1 family)
MQTKLRILTYHRIGSPLKGKKYEALTVLPERFRAQLKLMQLMNFTHSSLDDVAEKLKNKKKFPRKQIVLSFDDGFDELYEQVFPLLTQNHIPAIIYLVTDRTENNWKSRKALRPLKLLSPERICEMSRHGIMFGSHTRTHENLTRCTDDQLLNEVVNSKKVIEDMLGLEVKHFCYPYGAVNQRVADTVKLAGYKTACTTKKGSVYLNSNPFMLPRLTVGKRMNLLKFLLKITIKG